MGSDNIHGVEIYTESRYITYTEKKHTCSENIHKVRIYIKENIKLIRKRDIHEE